MNWWLTPPALVGFGAGVLVGLVVAGLFALLIGGIDHALRRLE